MELSVISSRRILKQNQISRTGSFVAMATDLSPVRLSFQSDSFLDHTHIKGSLLGFPGTGSTQAPSGLHRVWCGEEDRQSRDKPEASRRRSRHGETVAGDTLRSCLKDFLCCVCAHGSSKAISGNTFFSFKHSVSCIPSWPWSCHVAKDSLCAWILRLPPLKCWGYRRGYHTRLWLLFS